MRVLYVARLFSGLETSLLRGEWAPTGVPTIYKFIERLDRTVDDVVQEVVAGDPLAHEAALEVGEDDEDGVDLAGADLVLQGAALQPGARHGR